MDSVVTIRSKVQPGCPSTDPECSTPPPPILNEKAQLIKILQKGDMKLLDERSDSELNCRIAEISLQLNQYGDAIQYGNRAIDASGYDALIRCKARNIMAEAYIQIGKLTRAATLLINNLSFLKEGGDKGTLMNTHLSYGKLLAIQGNLGEAKVHALKGLTLAEKQKCEDSMLTSHKRLADLYKRDSDFEKALYHFETYHKMYFNLAPARETP